MKTIIIYSLIIIQIIVLFIFISIQTDLKKELSKETIDLKREQIVYLTESLKNPTQILWGDQFSYLESIKEIELLLESNVYFFDYKIFFFSYGILLMCLIILLHADHKKVKALINCNKPTSQATAVDKPNSKSD